MHIIEPVADAGIRMPRVRHNSRQLALFNIQHADAEDFLPPVLLQIHCLVFPMPIDGGIVQPGHRFQAELVVLFVNPLLIIHPVFPEGQHAVGVQQIRLKAVDHLIHAVQPVVPESLVSGIPGRTVSRILRAVFLVGMIEIPVCRIVAVVRYTGIGAEFVAALIHPPPGEGSPQMLADPETQAVLVRRRFPQGKDILFRTYVHAVHPVQL